MFDGAVSEAWSVQAASPIAATTTATLYKNFDLFIKKRISKRTTWDRAVADPLAIDVPSCKILAQNELRAPVRGWRNKLL